MNVRIYLTLVALAAFTVPAAYADYSEQSTTIETTPAPTTEMREEIRTQEVPSTTVIKEEPTVIEPVQKEKVVIKKHHGHLFQVGPIKLF